MELLEVFCQLLKVMICQKMHTCHLNVLVIALKINLFLFKSQFSFPISLANYICNFLFLHFFVSLKNVFKEIEIPMNKSSQILTKSFVINHIICKETIICLI